MNSSAAVTQKTRGKLPAIIGCLVVQLCVGILYLWSVFRDPVVASLGLAPDTATMISSYMLLGFVAGVFVGGVMNDRLGPKPTAIAGVAMFAGGVFLTGLLGKGNSGLMVLTYCAMGGLGSGFAYSACLSCIQKWLPHRRGFASGLAVSAFGLSTVVFAPLSEWLMGKFATGVAEVGGVETQVVNFFAVFSILAGVFFLLGMASCIFIKLPPEGYAPATKSGAPVQRVRERRFSEAVKTAPFWYIVVTMFFINGTWNLAVPLIKPLGLERGLTVALATFAVSFTGIPNAAGRLLMATFSDKIGCKAATCILAVMNLVGALLMTFITGIPYIVTVSLLAFAYGGPSAVNAALTTEFFGAKHFGTIYGVMTLTVGLSSIFFNFVSTKLLGGAVVPSFIMAAATSLIPIVMMALLAKREKKWFGE